MQKKRKQKKREQIFSNQLKGVVAIGTYAILMGVTPMPLTSEEIKFGSSNNYSDTKKNDTTELESLRNKLLEITRELHEYKAGLFRSTHPKDQIKIAELGKLLAEKELLNKQLSTALQTMDKEVSLARKQLLTQETSNDVLCAHIETQRQALQHKDEERKEQLAQLEALFNKEREGLIQKIALYESSEQNLLSSLNEKDQSLNNWQMAFSKQREFSNSLINEIGDLAALSVLLQQLHQQDLDINSAQNFTHLELSELIDQLKCKELHNQIDQLVLQIEQGESHLIQLTHEINIFQQMVLSQAKRTNNLEQSELEALSFAQDLTQNLIDAETQFLESEKTLVQTRSELEQAVSKMSELNFQLADALEQKKSLQTQVLHSSGLLEHQLELSTRGEFELEKTAAELEEAKNQITAYHTLLFEKEEALKGMQEDLAGAHNDKAFLYSILEALYSELQSLDLRLAKAEKELEINEEKLLFAEADMAQHQAKELQLLLNLQEKEEEYLHLALHLKEKENDAFALHNTLQEKDSQQSEMLSELEKQKKQSLELQAHLQNWENQHAELHRQLQEKSDHYDLLHENLQERESAHSELLSLYKELEQQYTELHAHLQNQANQHESLQQQLQEKTDHYNQLHAYLQERETAHDQFLNRYKEQEQQYAELQAHLQNQTEQHETLQQQFQEKTDHYAVLQANLLERESAHSQLLNRYKEQEQMCFDLQSGLQNKEQQYLEMHANLKEKESQLQKVHQQLQEADALHSNVITHLEQSEDQQKQFYLNSSLALQDLEKSRAALDSEIIDLRHQLEEKEIHLAHTQSTLQREQKDHQAEIEEKERKLQESAHEVKMLIKHLEALALKHADAGDRTVELEADVNHLSSALADAETQLQKAGEQIQAMYNEIASLNQTLQANQQHYRQEYSSLKKQDEATIHLLNNRLNELALALEKEMMQQAEMQQAISQLIEHTTLQNNSLGEAARLYNSLDAENEFLKYRVKGFELTERAEKAKNSLKSQSDKSETADLTPHYHLLQPLLRME